MEDFAMFGGTQTYALTVALELGRLGHRAAIYSPVRGPMADYAHGVGATVLGRNELPESCDLVIAGDAPTCHELAGRYTDAVRLFVAHSADFVVQAPPQLAGRAHAIVVMNDRVRRTMETRPWHAPIVRLRQPIDRFRYHDLGAARTRPRRALVLSNTLEGTRAEIVADACDQAGLELVWVGTNTTPTPRPEAEIARADLVIGMGRSVLEGMAAGRAAFVYGVTGGDGWVTAENYPALEADGFAATGSELIFDANAMALELARWDPQMGEVNRDLCTLHHSSREHVIELVKLAAELDPAPAPEPTMSDEFASLARLQWQSEGALTGVLAEARRLRSELVEREIEAEALRGELETLRGQLAALRDTRRYRLASRLAAPLDRARDRVSRQNGR